MAFPEAMNPLPDPAFLAALGFPSSYITMNNFFVGAGWRSLAIWVIIGAVIGLLLLKPPQFSDVLLTSVTGAGSIVGVWVLASLDGGAFNRHAVPYSLMVPIILVVLVAQLAALARAKWHQIQRT